MGPKGGTCFRPAISGGRGRAHAGGGATSGATGSGGADVACAYTVLYDHADLDNLEYFGSMKASEYISTNRSPTEEAAHTFPAQPTGRHETLRGRCFLEVLRHRLASESHLCGIPVPYTDEVISRRAGVQGRATPGSNASGLADLQEHSAWPAWRAMLDRGMTEWEATRSLHSGPKFFKELARGNEFVLDADRQKSFPNAVRDRYPDLQAVDQWVSNPMGCVALCGLESISSNLKLVKSFCNSAGGSGASFERDWLRTAGLPLLPEWLQAYRQDLRMAAERDTACKPALVGIFKSLGHDAREVQNKVHYVCNAHA